MIFFAESSDTATVVLGGSEHEVARAHLGLWLALEQHRRKGISPVTITSYLKAYGLPEGGGLESLRAYAILLRLTAPRIDFPMLHSEQHDTKSKPIPWDYEGRWAVSWIHQMASKYGWSRKEILDLPIEEAFGYIQELTVDEQLEKEFTHGLSEVAYSYDKTTGKSNLVPLKRPIWMNGPVALASKKLRTIPEALKPQGKIMTHEELNSLLSKRSSPFSLG